MRERTVVEAAVVFKPSRMARVAVQVLRRNVVVLTGDHSAKAGEKAFGLVGTSTVKAVGDRMIDAERLEARMKRVPMSGFVGKEGRTYVRNSVGNGNAFGFALGY